MSFTLGRLSSTLIVLVFASMVVVAFSSQSPYGPQTYQPMPHQFLYNVRDEYGNDFGHNENSDGKNVQGEYRVQLPDGRVQVVSYTANHDTGFLANVQYQGEAQYPPPAPASKPNYGH
ncbi:cuticle protein 7-like [Oratosquilla oratoria]|uniref:cuticle protein 7-like n=1 Tax=Oratosquilla oratoria TaxID=337810 RepID=UPI003F76465B